MRTIYLLLLLLVTHTTFSTAAYAQGRADRSASQRTAQGEISGVVTDEQQNSPLPSATVALWTASDSTLVTGTITAPDGSFSINGLRPGKYDVRISFVGYLSRTISDIELAPSNMRVSLDDVALTADAQLMDEVEVAAEREFVEVGVDRTIYNTKDQLVSAGGSVSDVLENIPSVEVDIEGNISLRGSQNVAILINGRPSPMTGEALTAYLQGLPAEMIERVEVIPNPSAKYEPDGMAGILNLELKKDQDPGLSGSLTSSVATPESYSASGNIGYQKGKVGLFAGYGFRLGTRDSEGWRYRENRFLDPSTYLDQESFDDRSRLSHNINTNFDYNLGRQSTLSLASRFSFRSGDDEGLTAYSELGANELLTSRYDRQTFEDESEFSSEYRLSFRKIVDPGKHELNIELEYEQESEDEDGLYNQSVFNLADMTQATLEESEGDLQSESNKEVSLQIDYTQPVGKEAKMDIGFKGDVERIDNEFFAEYMDMDTGLFIPDVSQNNRFIYDQNIFAAYGILGGKLGKFALQGGVRLEQAYTTFDLETTGESFTNNYFSVFPSAFAVYEFTDTQSLKLSYSKRINRPRSGWQLNPFDSNQDPLFRRVGNPYLKPEYVHAFELSFTQFTDATSLTFTPYFRHTVDEIKFFETLREDGVTIVTFENFDTSNSWGTEVIGTYKWGRQLNAYASFNVYRVVTDGSSVDTGLSNKAIGFSSRGNATYNVSPTMAVQFSYYYRAPMNIENGRMAARQSADLAVRQKVLKDKGNLSFRVRDVFNTMGFRVLREDSRYFQEINRTFQSQSFGVSFTYNFGKQDRRRNRNQDRGGNDFGDMEMGG